MKHLKFAALILAIGLASFTTIKEKSQQKVWPYNWYTYIGEPNDYAHQFDEDWYILDEDQWPDCTVPLGYIRCEVKCMGDAWIEGKPDFSTIQAIRYRPL